MFRSRLSPAQQERQAGNSSIHHGAGLDELKTGAGGGRAALLLFGDPEDGPRHYSVGGKIHGLGLSPARREWINF